MLQKQMKSYEFFLEKCEAMAMLEMEMKIIKNKQLTIKLRHFHLKRTFSS